MTDSIDIVVQIIAIPIAIAILVNALEDSFIDANYYLRGLFRKRFRRVHRDDLDQALPKRIAVVIPAWRESAVIERMIDHLLATVDYDPACYDVFCGTYPNDPETGERVEAAAARATNVRHVTVPHDGPTSKGDCLNWVYQGIRLEENRRGFRYEVILMHDAEDMVHPLSFKLYNYLVPEYDFVQTPVFAMRPPLSSLVGATYADEFAEHHMKDMLVRERIGGLVPSAGVGSAFSRQALEEVAGAHHQEPFNPESLTEDYEIGVKMRLAGKKTRFACLAIDSDDWVATRECFPSSFRQAVRQRSRWILGIALQTWELVGWKGPLSVRYCLWRDRKALVTNIVAMSAYGIVAYALVRWLFALTTGADWSLARIFPPGSLLYWIVLVNASLLVWRAAVKISLVWQLYGPAHGLLSVPRIFVSNVVNFLATVLAIRQWASHKWTGQPLRWLKTDHVFPDFGLLGASTAAPVVRALSASPSAA